MVKYITFAGAGFAGLSLAQKLNNRSQNGATFIDQVNYNQFQPFMYRLTTTGLTVKH